MLRGLYIMGHALNNTLQDILARYHRLEEYEVSWASRNGLMPGIATQECVRKTMLTASRAKSQDEDFRDRRTHTFSIAHTKGSSGDIGHTKNKFRERTHIFKNSHFTTTTSEFT